MEVHSGPATPQVYAAHGHMHAYAPVCMYTCCWDGPVRQLVRARLGRGVRSERSERSQSAARTESDARDESDAWTDPRHYDLGEGGGGGEVRDRVRERVRVGWQ